MEVFQGEKLWLLIITGMDSILELVWRKLEDELERRLGI